MLKDLKKVIIKRNALPFSLTYFVTNKCNLFCNHCFYWQNLNQNTNELSLSEIDKFSRSLPGLRVLIITGGEPFIREDFADIAKALIKNLKLPKLIINTNGSLTEKIVKAANEILKHSNQTHITFHFSLDGIEADHDALRNTAGLFQKVTTTIEEMKKLKKYYSKFNIGVVLTVNPINQTRIMDIYQYIRDNIRPDVISPVLMRLRSKQLDSQDVDVTYYECLIKQLKRDIDSNKLSGHSNFPLAGIVNRINRLKHEYIIKTVNEQRLIIPCFSGILSGVIYEDGRVSPCEILNDDFGNLRDYDYDFKQLWLNKKAEEIRQRIKQIKCFCTYECAMDVNVAFNLNSLIKII